MHVTDTSPVLLVGASGRVGRMVQHHWPNFVDTELVPQFRKQFYSGRCVVWDPLGSQQAFTNIGAKFGGFSAMIVLAGVTSSSTSDLNLNVEISEACLELAARTGIRRVLLASSSAVYGVGSGKSFLETDTCTPASDYGAAKLKMERSGSVWRKEGLELCILRIGNVAGADALLLNVQQTRAGVPIEIDIFNDGHGPVRSYIGAQTLASVLYSLCKHNRRLPEVVNIGAPEPVAMESLANAASHPWYARTPAGSVPQRIILNCDLVSSLHKFGEMDSRPDEMVRQWKETIKQ